MGILTRAWNWLWGQTVFNKIVIVGLFATFVPFVLPTVVAWFRPTMIKVGVAFYTYERAAQPQGINTLYFFEKRNLVSGCSIHRTEESVLSGRATAPASQAWVVIKLLLENTSDRAITDLRVGVRSPAINPATRVSTAPNLGAVGNREAPLGARPLYVISMETLPAESSVVVSLKTPIDDNMRDFIYDKKRTVTIQVPYVSANQFREYPPIVSRTNATKILNREGVLRTDDDVSSEEKIQVTLLSPDEPDVKDGETTYQLLPKAKACSEAEAGVW